MNVNAYSEDQMIQAGTADFLTEHLGWRLTYAFDREDFGPASLLGRSHRGGVVLVRALRQLVADDAGKSLCEINEDKHCSTASRSRPATRLGDCAVMC